MPPEILHLQCLAMFTSPLALASSEGREDFIEKLGSGAEPKAREGLYREEGHIPQGKLIS